jgi:hypothetical protein
MRLAAPLMFTPKPKGTTPAGIAVFAKADYAVRPFAGSCYGPVRAPERELEEASPGGCLLFGEPGSLPDPAVPPRRRPPAHGGPLA